MYKMIGVKKSGKTENAVIVSNEAVINNLLDTFDLIQNGDDITVFKNEKNGIIHIIFDNGEGEIYVPYNK